MAMTRRQFLKRTGIATAGTVVGPSLFRNPLLRNALAATGNYLVIFYLDGGNDGLNTIVPADNGTVGTGGLRDQYQAARVAGAGGLRLPTSGTGALLIPSNPAPAMLDENTGAQLGFHPGLQGIKNLYAQGHVAVIQGVGYPNANLSHDESSRRWETGDPFGVLGSDGWVGRYLEDNYGGLDIPGVNIRDNVAGTFAQGGTGVLALRRVTDFSFPYGSGLGSTERGRLATAFADVHNAASVTSANPTYPYTGNTGWLAQQATQAYPFLDSEYRTQRATYNQRYTDLNTGSARNLREIAKVIWGVVNNAHPGVVTARYFETRQGGYDTHSDQGVGTAGNQQYSLFRQMGDAIELFYEDVGAMQAGLGDKITILVWSEFSRRIGQNDTGTDHGTQGPVFVIGGKVVGGVYGNHPDISPAALDSDGNTVYSQAAANASRSTDLRDVYGTVLNRWLGVTDPLTMLPIDGGSPSTRWTVPDFDMGFLP